MKTSNIIDRNNFDGWMAQGGKDIVERSYAKAIDMIENGKPKMPLPEDTRKALHDMLLEAEADKNEELARR